MAQLGHSQKLILSLASASLGFGLSLITRNDYSPGCWGNTFMLFALMLLSASVSLGIWCAINRLKDFRTTASIARDSDADKCRRKTHLCKEAWNSYMAVILLADWNFLGWSRSLSHVTYDDIPRKAVLREPWQ